MSQEKVKNILYLSLDMVNNRLAAMKVQRKKYSNVIRNFSILNLNLNS